MKKLLILLLFISSLSFAYDTHEEIDALTVDDVLHPLLRAVYPDCRYRVEEPNPFLFEFLINDTGTPECDLDLVVLEDRLNTYKVEQHEILTYRDILNEKKLEAKNKFLQVRPNFHRALQKAGLLHISNPDAWIRDNCRLATTHEQIDLCIVKFDHLVNQLPAIAEEDRIKAERVAECKQLKTQLTNFDAETVTTGNIIAITKSLIKIQQCKLEGK